MSTVSGIGLGKTSRNLNREKNGMRLAVSSIVPFMRYTEYTEI
jgi:hypothetical protein